MNNGTRNKLIIISLAVCVLLILALFIQYLLSETKGVHIVSWKVSTHREQKNVKIGRIKCGNLGVRRI